MKKLLLHVFTFCLGAAAASLIIFKVIIGNAPALVYVQAMEGRAHTALELRMGQHENFLKSFEQNAPYDVKTLATFGTNKPYVQSALRKYQAYYQAADIPVPEEISAFFAIVGNNSPPMPTRKDRDAKAFARVKPGDPAPLRSLTDITGKKWDFEGKVILLNFFATWCGPCMQELPLLDKSFASEMKSGELLVLGIGRNHSEAELKAFQQKHNFNFPLVADTDAKIYDLFATKYIPRNVVIGRTGRVIFENVGFRLEEFPGLQKAVTKELVTARQDAR
jgi:peroxiredoxin